MAKLGVRTVDEMVGRTDLLKKKDFLTGQAAKVDLSLILQGMNEGERKNCVFDPDLSLIHILDVFKNAVCMFFLNETAVRPDPIF